MGRRGTGRRPLLLLAAALVACVNNPPLPGPGARLALAPVAFSDLPGWSEDNLAEALLALKASCGKLATLAPESPMGPGAIAGRGRDWAAACREAAVLPADNAAARKFFERNFRAYRLMDAAIGDRAFLTGYYQPELRGSRAPRPGFTVPLYRLPPDLAAPTYSRSEIDAGALAGRGLELVWLADPIDAFFVSIQAGLWPSASPAATDGPMSPSAAIW
jgi:membrane-bound lytic murein transglycosylase A